MLHPLRQGLLATVAAAALSLCLSQAVLARDFRSADVHPADYPTVEIISKAR